MATATAMVMNHRRIVTCVRCGRAFGSGSWAELALLERLRHENLRDLFTNWPWRDDDTLEIRQCSCGHDVARLVRPR